MSSTTPLHVFVLRFILLILFAVATIVGFCIAAAITADDYTNCLCCGKLLEDQQYRCLPCECDSIKVIKSE